jgi:hypothetical protein
MSFSFAGGKCVSSIYYLKIYSVLVFLDIIDHLCVEVTRWQYFGLLSDPVPITLAAQSKA